MNKSPLVMAPPSSDCDGSTKDRQPKAFARDTRLISYYEISLNRQPLQLLASSTHPSRIALYQFTNPELLTVRVLLPSSRLIVAVARHPGMRMRILTLQTIIWNGSSFS